MRHAGTAGVAVTTPTPGRERRPGWLSAVDPRVKLAWVLATLVAGLAFVDPRSLLVVLASIILVAALAGTLRAALQRLSSLGVVVIVIGLIMGLTVPGDPLLALGPLQISRQGLVLGLVSILRLFVFALPLVVVVMSTTNTDLIRGLMAFRLPLDYALMIVLALNFVPLYLEEFRRIADAQKARAHDLVDRGLLGKARGLLPIFVPLTLNAVDRADTVGKVLEIRGIARRRFRAEFDPLGAADWALLAVSIALAGAAVASAALGTDLLAAPLARLG
ncbi:MAG TPA: energy-coupling factor transporter transmembrane component T [Chloroflexota bacterium]|nr:energy-coupling factor transporter transmembrane component T [Chloroflexota bacterium]